VVDRVLILSAELSEKLLANERKRPPTKRKARHEMHHHPHILNAACNLLGICFIIIGSLKLADLNNRSYGDEAAWAAASLFFVSIVTSYLAVRNDNQKEWQLFVADYAFIIGLVTLMASVCLAAISI